MSNEKKKFSVSSLLKKSVALIAVIAILVIGLGFNSVMEYVDNTEYAIHQNAFTGKLAVWNDAGWHVQMFGKVVKFSKAGEIYLSSDDLDGGSGKESQPVSVVFPDGKADVDVVTRYELALIDSIQMELYRKYGNPQAVHNMIRGQIIEAVQGVGPLMSSSEAYSDRKPEVALLSRSMSLEGIYASQVNIDTTFDNDSNTVLVKSYDTKVRNDKPVITKESVLGAYNIVLPVFSVKNMEFDSKTVKLIEARKDAQLAKQSAITAFQNGQASIAKEKATQEVEKIKQVTIAEKEAEVARIKAEKEKSVAVTNATKDSEVATLNAERAKQVALKTIREAKAEADANALKVKAGLTPQERAEWAYKTAVDGQKAMFGPGIGSWDLPDVMAGGSSEGGSSSFMDALGVNQLFELKEKLTK